MMFGGIKIHVTPDRPKMKLSAECPVTPDFRAEMDLWLLSFFGTTNLIPDGQAYDTPNGMFMNPRTHAALVAAKKGTP